MYYFFFNCIDCYLLLDDFVEFYESFLQYVSCNINIIREDIIKLFFIIDCNYIINIYKD